MENQKNTPNKKVVIGVTTAIAAVAIIIGAIAGVNYHNAMEEKAKQEAFDNAVYAVYSDYEVKFNDTISGAKDLDHAGRLEAIKNLETMKNDLDKDTLVLYNGDVYGYDELVKILDDGINTLKVSIIDDYNKAVTDADIDVNAEGVTKEQIQEKIDALNAVKTLVDSDKTVVVVFENKDYNDFIAAIDASIAACQAKIDEIVAAEEAAAKAAAEAASTASSYSYSYDGGGSPSYSGGGSSSGGGYTNSSGGTGWVDGQWIPPTDEQLDHWRNGGKLN